MQVDLVIPVLNEEDTLAQNVTKVIRFLESMPIDDCDIRIVIADNGSTDATPQIGRNLSRDFNGLVSFTRVDGRGVGRALKHAWADSTAEIVGYMDLDLATDLKHLPEAITPLLEDRYDVVYGSRLHRRSSVIGRRASRAVVSRVFNRILRGYLGSRISDAMCGFKFLQRKWLADLREGGAQSDGWFFCAEFLLVAESRGLRLLELPVTWTDDPASKVNMPKLTREYLSAMHALKPRLQSNR